MDGVLIDSESIHKFAIVKAFLESGAALTDEQYAPYRGSPDETIMRELSLHFPSSRLEVATLLRRKNYHFEAHEHRAKAIPGAVEFVRWAKERYRIALATSGTPRNVRAALQLLGLEDAFACVMDRAAVTHPKPHPEVFLKAAMGLNCAPDECFVIEDSLNGVLAAKAAGCKVIAITTSFKRAQLIEVKADYVLDSFEEIRALLA